MSWTFVDRAPHVPAGNLIVDAGSLLVDAAIAGAGLCQTLDVLVEDAIREGRLVDGLADCAVRTPRSCSFLDHLAAKD